MASNQKPLNVRRWRSAELQLRLASNLATRQLACFQYSLDLALLAKVMKTGSEIFLAMAKELRSTKAARRIHRRAVPLIFAWVAFCHSGIAGEAEVPKPSLPAPAQPSSSPDKTDWWSFKPAVRPPVP